jgi:hypothetical protein
MTDLEPYRPTTLDRFTPHSRTVTKRLREVEAEAVVQARIMGHVEQLELLRAKAKIRGAVDLGHEAADRLPLLSEHIGTASRDNPGLELILRDIETVVGVVVKNAIYDYGNR